MVQVQLKLMNIRVHCTKKSKIHTSYVPCMYIHENMLHNSNEISLYVQNIFIKKPIKILQKWRLPARLP